MDIDKAGDNCSPTVFAVMAVVVLVAVFVRISRFSVNAPVLDDVLEGPRGVRLSHVLRFALLRPVTALFTFKQSYRMFWVSI